MRRLVVPTIIIFLQISGCSGKSDIDEANRKIAALEEQLAVEKAKNSGAKSAVVTPVSMPAPVASAAPTPVPTAEKTSSGSQWNYSANEEKMTGGTTYHAVVSSTNTVNFGFPYSGTQNASLRLRIDPKYGKDVMFSIEKGQILCHSYEDCSILVRFDEEKPRNYAAVGAADNSSETIFIRNYDQFVGNLRKAKRVRISANIYQQGSPVFEFDVSGFSAEKFRSKG